MVERNICDDVGSARTIETLADALLETFGDRALAIADRQLDMDSDTASVWRDVAMSLRQKLQKK